MQLRRLQIFKKSKISKSFRNLVRAINSYIILLEAKFFYCLQQHFRRSSNFLLLRRLSFEILYIMPKNAHNSMSVLENLYLIIKIKNKFHPLHIKFCVFLPNRCVIFLDTNVFYCLLQHFRRSRARYIPLYSTKFRALDIYLFIITFMFQPYHFYSIPLLFMFSHKIEIFIRYVLRWFFASCFSKRIWCVLRYSSYCL